MFICIAIFIHLKNSVRSALLTGPLLIMTHRKRCMPLQWKKKNKTKKNKTTTGSTGITEYPAGRLTLSLVLYPVPHWGVCKQPLHLPLGFYQLLLLITQTWNFFWWLFQPGSLVARLWTGPFSHLIVVFPFVKMDVRTIQLVVFAICLETRKRERVVFGDKETAKVVIRK